MWVAHLVGRPALRFGSGPDLGVMGSGSVLGWVFGTNSA